MLFSCMGDHTETTEAETTTAPDESSVPEGMMECTVSVSDYFGNAMAGINALIKRGGTIIQTIDLGNDGAETFLLEKGNYTVIFEKQEKPAQTQYWNYDFKYDENAATLSESSTELHATLYQKANGKEDVTFVDVDQTEKSSRITSGAYTVTLNTGANYFTFRPSQAGIYEVSYVSTADAIISYHGAPTWGYLEPLEVAENKILTVTVEPYNIGEDEMSTTPFVFCFNSQSTKKESFTIVFKKVGEPPKNPANEPWESYLNPNEIASFTLPANATLTNVDIFDKDLKVVFNDSDGYYHLGSANGPLIMIRLTSASEYLESFFTICNTTRLGTYIYDDQGNFVKKQQFNSLIYQYTGAPDENGTLIQGSGHYDSKTGVYPLDQYLAYAMQAFGGHMGWWDATHPQYIFGEVDADGTRINQEIAWLFACCYVAE